MKVVIITGLSGAGKTKAADWFEDQGYYCIDNMPPALIKNFIELSITNNNMIDKVAFVADIRGGEFFDDLDKCIEDLHNNDNVESTVIFLEASLGTLIRRYNETRRNHPLTGSKATAQVINTEKEKLSELRKKADHIIDTTNMKTSEFSAEMSRTLLGNEEKNTFNINITSFGYKYGIPQESDMQVDMRFIPNPYYVNSLRKLTGNNKKVSNYVLKFDISKKFLKQLDEMVNTLIPGYIREGKYHINLAVGCTGGHHRSVAMANAIGKMFEGEGKRVTITHRDLDFIKRGAGK